MSSRPSSGPGSAGGGSGSAPDGVPEALASAWRYTKAGAPWIKPLALAGATFGAVFLALGEGLATVVGTAWEALLIGPVQAVAAVLGSLVELVLGGQTATLETGAGQAEAFVASLGPFGGVVAVALALATAYVVNLGVEYALE